MSQRNDSEGDVQVLRNIVASVEVAMLATLDENHQIRSRPLVTQAWLEEENCLWFFTSAPSGKTEEIKDYPQVDLAYANPETGSYASISGPAQVVKDAEKSRELWSSKCERWFTGVDDPRLRLLRVHPQRAEYWTSQQANHSNIAPKTWSHGKLSFENSLEGVAT